jgi:hypothetical protein
MEFRVQGLFLRGVQLVQLSKGTLFHLGPRFVAVWVGAAVGAAGVSSGVSWLFYLLRRGALCCAECVTTEAA